MRALSRRDVRGPSDQVKLMVDSYFDRRNGYEFAVNPFAVWTQGRDRFHDLPNTRSWRGETDELFELHPDNTFLIKIAYWLSR